MTLRNASLTAVATLSLVLAGGAIAQDVTTAPGTTAPAGSSYHSGTAAPAPAPAAAAETPAAPAAEPAAPVAAEAPAEPAAEQAPEAPAEAAAEPAAAAPAETPAATEAPVAADTATSEAAPAAETLAAAEAPAAPAAEASAEPAEAEVAPATGAEAQTAAAENPEAEAPAAEAPAAPAPAAEGEHATAEGEHGDAAGAAAHAAPHIEDISFSFEGPFGSFDQFQLQRGLQVYTEVCAACHGLRYVPLRTLHDAGGPGLPEDQVRAYAATLTINDAETGEERPRVPTDHFPTISDEGMGPDLSLMAKSRAGFHGPYGSGVSQLFRGIGGPEYIHAVLVGYNGETKEEAGSTFYHNAAFSTGWIKMPPPLTDGQVTYEDGTEATVDQMARDVAAFLMWTAEPKMMDRKQVGLVSVLFLGVLAWLLYMTNKKLWHPVKYGRRQD